MSFDETIIHCGAPALCGIKPASLFSMDGAVFAGGRQKLRAWQAHFSKRKRYFVSLKKDGGRMLCFVYDQLLLARTLSEPRAAAYLRGKGYPVGRGFPAVLAELLHRLASCGVGTDASGGTFPHEVGLFLGYPLEDVIGFETQQARGSRYSGYWKVYGNVEDARRAMSRYRACSECCMRWLHGGLSVPLAAERYCGR